MNNAWLKKITIIFHAMLICLCISSAAYCATYYVDSNATTDGGTGTSSSPKKYIQSGINLMSGGDTLIIKNGTYTNTSDSIANIPNGSSGNYTTIQAAEVGGVTITRLGSLQMTASNSYITISGMNFNYSQGKGVLGHHVKVLKCGFRGSETSGNTVTVGCGSTTYGDAHDILFEDCYSYGSGGRYNFLIYRSYNVILRRCVVRHDPGWTGDGANDPEAGFNSYSSRYVYFQNCIAIDCDQSYVNWYSMFYATEHDGSMAQNNWDGCIALNGLNIGFYIDPTTNIDYHFGNCLAYKQTTANFAVVRGTNNGCSNLTLGDSNYNVYGSSVSNSILFNRSGGSLVSSTGSYCNIESAESACTSCKTYDPQTNGLLYPVRIESGSALSTAGSDGGQIGATIMKKIGVSGTLYGESGWNTVTSENLWPFPYEDRIRSDMRAVSARGFCADNQTLTKYIWQYLGNTIPSDIYGSGGTSPDTTPPVVPNGVSVEII